MVEQQNKQQGYLALHHRHTTDDESELWYDFNYITDIYYYSRKKSFLDLTSQLCDKKINLSLILYRNIETEKDSVIGVILF